MDWSNWIYLGAGLSLGLGLRELLARLLRSPDSHSVVNVENKDLSALEQQIEQTQLAYQMAQEMSLFKSGFLARTTHVLRSPLNGLIGLHQLILSDLCDNPDEEREFINQAHDRALKLLKLIDEILSVARIEHGTTKLAIQPVCFAELLQEVHKLTYMLAENRNFPFRLSPPDAEIYILADPHWLRQVLVNLLDASIARMEEGSISISTGLSPTNNFVYIWLDVPQNAIPFTEPVDLIESKDQLQENDQKNSALSLGTKLLLNQTLLEAMGGKLEFVASTTTDSTEHLTRLQLSIPRVIPEAEFQEQEVNLG
ncbi:MAG: HAMP domain-containing sensor histidine kinase [Rhizonema sp. PD37]|nr:HAMP domain-containing sensor histidine kinase [Rhizonema sp. PD37]